MMVAKNQRGISGKGGHECTVKAALVLIPQTKQPQCTAKMSKSPAPVRRCADTQCMSGILPSKWKLQQRLHSCRKNKDAKHRDNDMCTKCDTAGHALSHRRTCCIVRPGRLCVRLCNRSCTSHLVASPRKGPNNLAVWCVEQQHSSLSDNCRMCWGGRRGECDMPSDGHAHTMNRYGKRGRKHFHYDRLFFGSNITKE